MGELKSKNVIRHNDKEAVHVMVSEPTNIRKLVLKSAIETVRLLNGYSQVYTLREQQTAYFKHLNILQKEIGSIQDKILNFDMPEIEDDIEINKEVLEVPKQNKINVRESSDIERLRRELEDIEKKLSNL